MTVGYLLPKRLFHFGSAASICARNGCAAVPTMKSLLKPTGLVCGMRMAHDSVGSSIGSPSDDKCFEGVWPAVPFQEPLPRLTGFGLQQHSAHILVTQTANQDQQSLRVLCALEATVSERWIVQRQLRLLQLLEPL